MFDRFRLRRDRVNVFQGSPLRRRRTNSQPNAALESLEDRTLLTAYLVDTTADVVANDGMVSLREAIQASNTNAAVGNAAAGTANGDVIRFDASLAGQTITLALGELQITEDLFIDGQAQGVVISATNASRVFSINTSEFVRINSLVVTNGSTAASGGAISVNGGASVQLDNLTVTSSVAAGMGGGAIVNTGSSVLIRNSTISGNQASGASGSGGAILNGAGAITYVYSSTITGNSAIRAGGGIEDVSGTGLGVVLRNTDVTSNQAGLMGNAAPGNGGGIHVTGAGDVVVVGGTFDGNTAQLEGGALWNGTGTMTLRGVRITNNTATGASADDGGGGVFNNGGTLQILDTLITGNVANGALGSGGGIFSTAGSVAVTRSRISTNTAFRAGGGVELITGTFTALLSTLSGNIAGPMGNANPGNGGAFHVTGAGATTTIRLSNVLNNTAGREGGGLWNSAGSTMFVTQSSVNGNTAQGAAADDGGGAIFNNGGDVTVTGSTIANNVANGTAGSGGGIFSTDGFVIVERSLVNGNVANRAGGGIEIVTGSLVVFLTGMATNTAGPMGTAAPGNGGGVHVTGTDASVSIIGSNIRANVAASEGGGLWNAVGSSMFVTNSRIQGNMANNGGGIYDNGGRLDVVFSDLFDNAAAFSGGGLFLETGGEARVVSSNVTTNVAGTTGGGIYNDAALNLRNSTVTSNTATSGGGVFTDTNGVTTLDGADVSSNTPDDLAGPGMVV